LTSHVRQAIFDKLSRELEFFRKVRALIKQAEVEARLAGSHMVEAEHLPAAIAAVHFSPPVATAAHPRTHRTYPPHPPISQLTNNGLRNVLFLTYAHNRLLRTGLVELHGPPTPSKFRAAARAYETAFTRTVEAHPGSRGFCRCPVTPSCTAQPRRAR
jgi:hypothetical protein